jgi:hypothetical protein
MNEPRIAPCAGGRLSNTNRALEETSKRSRALTAVLLTVLATFGFPLRLAALPVHSSSGSRIATAGGPTDAFAVTPRETEVVANRLLALGCTPSKVRAILNQLSAEDTRELAMQIEQLQAAGGTRTRIWVAVGIVVLGVLIYAVANAAKNIRVFGSSNAAAGRLR